MAQPGVMLYFDILEPIKVLPNEDKGRLLVAILEYGKLGIVPEFDGMLALAWGFVRPKIDRDREEYNRSVLRRQYATACRERKKKNEPEITFDEWVKTLGIGDYHWYHLIPMITNGIQLQQQPHLHLHPQPHLHLHPHPQLQKQIHLQPQP